MEATENTITVYGVPQETADALLKRAGIEPEYTGAAWLLPVGCERGIAHAEVDSDRRFVWEKDEALLIALELLAEQAR